MSARAISVVVVAHRSRTELERLLDSIERFLDPAPQLVVVDTAPGHDDGELARSRGAQVLELPENPGFGAAANAGIERASAEVTALLNPDVELLDDGIAWLADIAAARDVLVAPRLLRPNGRVERGAHPVPGRAGPLLPALVHPALLPKGARLRAEPWRAERPRTVGWAVGACLVARTALLRRLGPFDPGAFLFFEDMDLCLRARRAGAPTELHPDVALLHRGGHATRPAFGGEPHDLLARRRRVVVAQLGPAALALDDAAQALTFATRALARVALRRDYSRERAQLVAVLRARRWRDAPLPG